MIGQITDIGPDGAERQAIAAGLLQAWRRNKAQAALLTGGSGLGKTDRLIRSLFEHASKLDILCLCISVPSYSTNMDEELLSLLVEQLEEQGNESLAEIVQSKGGFIGALKHLLRTGAVIVIDEFQRLLDEITGMPKNDLASKYKKMARREDNGYLILVSNRAADVAWSEPFHTATLYAPQELKDQLNIILEVLPHAVLKLKFPENRRNNVIARLGANPRLLRILAKLLDVYALDELLSSSVEQLDESVGPWLIDKIEKELLNKAKMGLSEDAQTLLRLLSIFEDHQKLELIRAIMPGKNVLNLLDELRSRYLVEAHLGRFRIHPPAREVEYRLLKKDTEAWRNAHRLAGKWFAVPMVQVNLYEIKNSELAWRLAGARHHLIEAGEKAVLQMALRGIEPYIDKKFGWEARRPMDNSERDAQILLLQIFLEQPGSQGVEYNYAKLLKSRGTSEDLTEALLHAELATKDIDMSEPWILRIKLLREVCGAQAALLVAQEAIKVVAPGSGLVSIYQLLGACHAHLGQTDISVSKLLEAVDIIVNANVDAKMCEELLIQEAIFFAAAHSTDVILFSVQNYLRNRTKFKPEAALTNVLLLERVGDWGNAAKAAHNAGVNYPDFFHLSLHEAFCWLADQKPSLAQQVLNSIKGGLREKPRLASMWLASLIALYNNDISNASKYLSIYLNSKAPISREDIYFVLLREWDYRVATVGEANPALNFPILPPVITKLSTLIRRPQFGLPVLQLDKKERHTEMKAIDKQLNILSIATEWESGNGGLSTFNRQLCIALAAHGANVVCVVSEIPSGGPSKIFDGVTLVGANRTYGQTEMEALQRKPNLPSEFIPDIIIGHGRVTGSAAQVVAADHFPNAKRLHFIHMAPDEIEWHKDNRDDDPAVRAEERTEIELTLGKSATHAVAVGPHLHGRFIRDIAGDGVQPPLRFDPGFDLAKTEPRTPPKGSPWAVLLLGRMEDETLKGLDIAARSIGKEVKLLSRNERIELIVRGVQEGTSEKTRKEIIRLANTYDLDVTPRLYSKDSNKIEGDIQRASLVLMPSRTEGFGLVGLEAIVAGTPVLVSSNSGLGKLLTSELSDEQSSRLVVSMSGGDEEVIEKWSNAIYAVLRNREAAFTNSEEIRVQLGREKTWKISVTKLLKEISANY